MRGAACSDEDDLEIAVILRRDRIERVRERGPRHAAHDDADERTGQAALRAGALRFPFAPGTARRAHYDLRAAMVASRTASTLASPLTLRYFGARGSPVADQSL